MTRKAASIAIVSGYFNPLNVGHLDLMEDARRRADLLVVIVNNDAQQAARFGGQIAVPEADRMRLVRALKVVDGTLVALDSDGTVARTLDALRLRYGASLLTFCNGGPQTPETLPISEVATAERLKIILAYGVGNRIEVNA